jgi:hypothetical protein
MLLGLSIKMLTRGRREIEKKSYRDEQIKSKLV